MTERDVGVALVTVIGLGAILASLVHTFIAITRPGGRAVAHHGRPRQRGETSNRGTSTALPSWLFWPDRATLTEQEIERHCRELAAQHRLPAGWTAVDAARLLRIRARRAQLLQGEYGPR